MANAVIRPRGDTAANWTAGNPVLALREHGYELDTGKFKVGDGTTAWTSLAYFGGGGSVAWASITGVPAAVSGTTASFTTAQETKLAGIASGATANAADADLRDRSTHTGTQAAGTITGLATVATTGAYADLSGLPTLFSGAYGDLSGIPSTFTPSAHSHVIADVTGLQGALDAKQATLVSGTSIKTINGESVLGSGDIVVSGGGDPWNYVKLAENAVTTTTANTATALAFTPLLPETHYLFEGFLFLQAAATTTGARPGILWPGGTVQESAWMLAPSSATAFASRFWGAPTSANAAATGVAVADEGMHGRFEGQFVTGLSPTGSLRISIATEVAGSEARIMANSWLRWRTI